MTIFEALKSLNTFPIQDNAIERICVNRGLISTELYDSAVAISQSFELAIADILMYLHDAPSIVEQEVGVNNAISIKREMMEAANKIYVKYNDSKLLGNVYGFIGENWNG